VTTVDEIAGRLGVLRAGGTDLMARGPRQPYVDLTGVSNVVGITRDVDGSVRIGAMTTIASVADELRSTHPALALTAGALATPQIRAVGTIGGNLLQRNRCWYYRHPEFTCYQDGGDSCPARSGNHLYSVVIDQGPCVAPHPSSVAMALLAYNAVVEVHGRAPLAVRDLYGDGSDPTRDHLLPDGSVLMAVRLPPPLAGEHAAYHRAISRCEAEWPLVEAVARIVVSEGAISFAAVAVGGVARTPLRLPEVEATLVGATPSVERLRAAASQAAQRCSPLPQTGYKIPLMTGTILEVLEEAVLPG
jgi:xanthine dehydrogenase YagS FAD-binding subunit